MTSSARANATGRPSCHSEGRNSLIFHLFLRCLKSPLRESQVAKGPQEEDVDDESRIVSIGGILRPFLEENWSVGCREVDFRSPSVWFDQVIPFDVSCLGGFILPRPPPSSRYFQLDSE